MSGPTARNLATCKIAKGPFKPHHRRCNWCAKKLPKRKKKWCSVFCSRAYNINHHWAAARSAAKKRDGYKCTQCGAKEKLEVNHIDPCLGKHQQDGCWHHQQNLETLCHSCHVGVTRKQREEGKLP